MYISLKLQTDAYNDGNGKYVSASITVSIFTKYFLEINKKYITNIT
jgi:hypothetical protein